MRSEMWPGTGEVELRRNTSKRGFDVLRDSDKAPTCRRLVGGCFITFGYEFAYSSDKPPHLLVD